MKTTIYSTETYSDQVEAQFKCEPYDKILIQIEDNNLVDTRTGEEYTDGYRATLCTVSKFGNLFINYGFTCKGKSLASCKRAANRMLHKYFNLHLSDVVAEGSTLEEMHASLTDPTIHENFKVWAANLFMAENDPETETPENYDAEDAAYSLINAYADAIGERPAETDPEYVAAFAVAGEEIAGWHGVADIHDRATVSAMVEAIADAARFMRPFAIASAAADRLCEAYDATTGNLTAAAYDAAQVVARAEIAGCHATDTDYAWVRQMVEAIADATRAANPENLEEPAPTYQRYELEAYLGDLEAYDVDAIMQDMETTGASLADAAERHELYSYAPAI